MEGVTWYLYVIMSTKDILNALNVYFTCLEEFYIYLPYNLHEIILRLPNHTEHMHANCCHGSKECLYGKPFKSGYIKVPS